MKKSLIFTFSILNFLSFSLINSASVESQKLLTTKGRPLDNLSKVVQGEPSETIGKGSAIGQEVQENTHAFSKVLDASNPSRFKTIKLHPEIAMNEIDFWGRQMSEHALFLHLGLEDPALKKEALSIHKRLENFRKTFNLNPQDLNHMNNILPLLQEERAFKIKVLKALTSGVWLGWLFPTFLNHVTMELDYFVDKLNGIKYTPEQEIAFWNRVNSEHAGLTAKLLDPVEENLAKQAKKLSSKLMSIPRNEKEMMVGLSIKANRELDQYNKEAKVRAKNIDSIVHPVLLDHMIREGERTLKTLSKLNIPSHVMSHFRNQVTQDINQYRK